MKRIIWVLILPAIVVAVIWSTIEVPIVQMAYPYAEAKALKLKGFTDIKFVESPLHRGQKNAPVGFEATAKDGRRACGYVVNEFPASDYAPKELKTIEPVVRVIGYAATQGQ